MVLTRATNDSHNRHPCLFILLNIRSHILSSASCTTITKYESIPPTKYPIDKCVNYFEIPQHVQLLHQGSTTLLIANRQTNMMRCNKKQESG